MQDELNEVSETQPIEQMPSEEISDTLPLSEEGGTQGEPVSEEEQPISESQAIAKSQALAQEQLGPLKPKSNIFSLLLIISIIFIVLAIYMVAHELNHYYGVTFGGIISVPEKNIETPESGK